MAGLVEKGRISSRQLALLLFSTVISTITVYPPSLVAGVAGRDAWLAVVLATAYTLLLWWVIAALASRFPGETAVQYARQVLGRWLGSLVGMVFIFFFFVLGFNVARVMGEIMTTAFMPRTPEVVIVAILVVLSAYAVYGGLEVIARVNEILLPVGVAVLLFVGASSLSTVDFANFLPLLEEGLRPVNWGGVLLLSFTGEVVLALMLFPFVQDREAVARDGALTIIGLGAAMQIGVLAIGLYTPEVAAKMVFPALEMVRGVSLGKLISHLDVLIMGVWIGGIFIKLAVLYYAAVLGLAQWLGLEDYRPLVAPTGVLLVAFSLLAYRTQGEYYTTALMEVFPGQALIHEFCLPLLLLLVARLRGLRGGEG